MLLLNRALIAAAPLGTLQSFDRLYVTDVDGDSYSIAFGDQRTQA